MRAFIKKISFIKKDQNGFTLIELLTSIAISGIVILGLVISIFQLWKGHAQASGEMTVVQQVQQAGYYMSNDVHMAREVLIDTNPATPEIVTLTWYWYLYHDQDPDRDGEGLRVIYTLDEGKLYRNYDVFYEDAEGNVTFGSLPYDYKTFIAEHISNIEIVPISDNYYSITITASVDGVAGEQAETRTYKAKNRPNVF